jgi:hypothetical protein
MPHDSDTYQAYLKARYLMERLHSVYVQNCHGFDSSYDKTRMKTEFSDLQHAIAILQDKES